MCEWMLNLIENLWENINKIPYSTYKILKCLENGDKLISLGNTILAVL